MGIVIGGTAMAGPNDQERVGLYIACGGGYPEDATIRLGDPACDLVKLVKPGSLRVKTVAPGVNVEKAPDDTLAGVILFPPPVNSDKIAYDPIDPQERQALRHIFKCLDKTLSSFKALIQPLLQHP